MGTYVDIGALASEALHLVEEQEKTASYEEPVEELKTEIGRALKQAATYIRDCTETEVGVADLELLKNAKVNTKVAALSPLPATDPSEAGNRFRKLASRVRERGSEQAETRIIKAAQMLNAAVALKHLNRLAAPLGKGN